MVFFVCILFYSNLSAIESFPGDSRVLKWKDGRKAVFFLGFDDSCRSHVKNAIPELEKRRLVGTFYVNPGNGPYKSEKEAWTDILPESPAVVYGNHTYTHCGATNTVQLDRELMRCHEVIYASYPDKRKPFLVSFARPGGVPWTVTDELKKTALSKYHLIERPPFFGYPIHIKSRQALLELVDKTIESGEMGHHDFHGIGGDWLVTPMDVYIALLDKLAACREELWITDHISWHKYKTERACTKVSVKSIDTHSINISLVSSVDSALYDIPLTLETVVPAEWKKCRVVQGNTSCQCIASGGVVRYDALPNAEIIVISLIN